MFKKLVGRKLSARKSVTANGDLEAFTRTNHNEQQGNKQGEKYRLKDGPGTGYSRRNMQGDSMV